MENQFPIKTKPEDLFKTFPEFSPLTYADRKVYEALINDYPPRAGTLFQNIMAWWNILNSAAVSSLNGNMVISYWMPGNERLSGLALIGTEKVDESICEIFDYQRSQGEEPRLVHIPDFVVKHMIHPEMFNCKNEVRVDEHVLEVSNFFPVENLPRLRRARIQKFEKRHKNTSVEIVPIDLKKRQGRELVLGSAAKWKRRFFLNNPFKHMEDSMAVAVNDADMLDTQCLGLFVGGELEAFLVYFMHADTRYVTLTHANYRTNALYSFDYSLFAFAKWFHDQGAEYINMDSDLGIPAMRTLKAALGASIHFRFYTVEPA